MPRSGGTYSLPPTYLAQAGTVIRSEQHNTPLEDIAVALTGSLARDGSSVMLGNLPMNGRKITNLGAGTAAGDAVRFDQLPPTISPWLQSVSALTLAANQIPYATGATTSAVTALTAWARTLLDDADLAAAWVTLGLATANQTTWNTGTSEVEALISPLKLAAKIAQATAVQEALFEDRKDAGNAGGANTSGVWNVRDVNTVAYNTITGASLAANQITLPAGTYYCEVSAPGYSVGGHILRLRSTNNVTQITGTSEFSNSGDPSMTRSFIRGRFTINAERQIEVQHWTAITRSNGLGVATAAGGGGGGGGTGEQELYTTVYFRKIG